MKRIGLLIIAGALGLLLVEPSYAVNFVCGQDSNGNGTATDPGETAQCVSAAEGLLCPVGAVNCTATYTPASCPAWGALNGGTDQCQGQNSGSGSGQICTDDVLYARIYQESPTRYHLQLLDTGPGGDAHRNCGGVGSGGGIGDWHTLQIIDLPTPPSSLIFTVNASGSGCSPTGVSSVSQVNQAVAVLICSARGRQVPSYTYSYAFDMSASPACSSGTYDLFQNQCYQGDRTCPLGSQYSCMNNAGTYQCSPNACVDLDAAPPQTITPNLTSYRNNGQTDPNTGLCMGPVFIFNGKGSECRPPGAGTSFFNCCSNGSGDFLVFKKYCADAEWSTNAAREAESCRYVGDYCKTSWPLVGCVQKSQVYCCFNSKLGRMIQEQGRGQLKKFAPDGQWGTTDSPNCVGFGPEEMQMLDFSRMDLSEYFADISSKSQSQINQGMENKVDEFYRNLQP